MQKEIESFSETDDYDFDNELLDALAMERSAIQEIEQEKEENYLTEETSSLAVTARAASRHLPIRRKTFQKCFAFALLLCPLITKKTVEGYPERSPDPAGGFRTDRRRFPKCAVMVGQA